MSRRSATTALVIEPPPFYDNPDDWISTSEAAKHFRRSERTIRLWCLNGTFAEFGIKTYRDLLGIWHIHNPKPRAAASAT